MARKSTPLLSGWERVGTTKGGSGLYKNPQGETVSRRQYENARAQANGWKSWSAFNKFSKESLKDANYRRMAAAAQDNSGKKLTDLRKMDSEFAKKFRDAFANKDGSIGGRKPDRSLRGSLHNLLVEVGFRDEDADWLPGETPE